MSLAIIIALTMTACSDTNTAEVSDLPDITESSTVLTEDTTTAEETTTTTTTAEFTTVSETETEAVSDIVVDIEQNIKQAINDFGESFAYSTLFITDLNEDGIDEIIISCQDIGPDGRTSIYDVSEKTELLTKFYGCHFNTDTDTVNWEYQDENGKIHYIMRVSTWGSSDSYYSGYYDITYIDGEINISVPFLGLPYTWYDGGEFKGDWYLYSDCLYNHSVGMGMSLNFPFTTKNNEVIIEYPTTRIDVEEFIGEYPREAFDYRDTGDSDEIKAMIDEKVFSGMTFVKDIDTVVYPSTNDMPKNFEEYYAVVRDEIMKHYSSN